jgi:hypothetical protein
MWTIVFGKEDEVTGFALWNSLIPSTAASDRMTTNATKNTMGKNLRFAKLDTFTRTLLGLEAKKLHLTTCY